MNSHCSNSISASVWGRCSTFASALPGEAVGGRGFRSSAGKPPLREDPRIAPVASSVHEPLVSGTPTAISRCRHEAARSESCSARTEM